MPPEPLAWTRGHSSYNDLVVEARQSWGTVQQDAGALLATSKCQASYNHAFQLMERAGLDGAEDELCQILTALLDDRLAVPFTRTSGVRGEIIKDP